MTIIKIPTRLEIDPLVEIEEHHTEVGVDLNNIMTRISGKIIEEDHKTITEMTLGEKITDIRIIEIEVIVEMITEIITGMTIDKTIILVETEVG